MLKPALAALFLTLTSAAQTSPLPAVTPAERSWIITAAADLEANPRGPKAADERSHMLMLVLNRSGINIIACTNLVADIPKADADNYPILMQAWYSSAAYAVQHNGGSPNDPNQIQAGIEGALRVYEKFVAAVPANRNPTLDAVITLRNTGKLHAYAAGRPAVCKCCK